ncbi:MAG: glycosyltransferase family 4 protein [Planctomycetaceae bacterium]
MTPKIRLTVVMTHPVQYYAPWFRYVAANCAAIDLTVVYATQPTPQQQGTGFGTAFAWDVPLLEGYRSVIVREARPDDDVGGTYRGLDVPEIGETILKTKPDVVLVPGWSSITLVRAIRVCRRAGIPLIYRGDSILQTPHRGWRKIARSLRARYFLWQYAGFLSVGTRSREYLRRHGVPATRIFASPHCIDNDFFASAATPHQSSESRRAIRAEWGLPEDAFVALFVGKVEEQKRLFDLIDAASRLGDKLALLVVGTGPLLDECRNEAERRGVTVVWTGFLNQSEIGRAYAAADCLVLPSQRETWGLVVNEALATGLPCVVSDAVGCAPDLISPGETGETFPVGDVDALAAALDRVRERTQEGHDWRPACRERAERLSFEQATVGLVAACEATAGRAVASRRNAGVDGVDLTDADCRSARVLAVCGGMVVVFGLERMTFEALRALRTGGGAVHCIVNEWENHRIVDLAERIGASWSIGRYGYAVRRTRNPIELLMTAFRVARTSVELCREVARFRPTHVLLPEYGSIIRNYPALLALRVCGIKTVLRLGNAPPEKLFYRRFFRWVVDPAVEHYVCVSEFVRDELIRYGIPRHKTSVIYNSLQIDREDKVDSRPQQRFQNRLIYVGQIIPEKNVRVLIEAIGLLRRRNVDVTLDIVGPFEGWTREGYREYREQFLARANEPDLRNCVRFLGRRNDVIDLMSAASLHVAPSSDEMGEGCPNVVLEAKSAGLPTVAFNLGPYPELIEHGETGWLCDDQNETSLADGIAAMLAEPERLMNLGDAARKSLRKFSRKRFSSRWIGLFSGNAESAAPETNDEKRSDDVFDHMSVSSFPHHRCDCISSGNNI